MTTNDLGPFPTEKSVCATLRDRKGKLILESYVYKNTFFRFNWHASLEIMIVLKGSLKTCTERGVFDLDEEGLVIINPNIGHASMKRHPDTTTAVLHISKDYLERLMGNVTLPFFECYCRCGIESEPIHHMIRSVVATIFMAQTKGHSHSDLVVKSNLYLLCSALLSQRSDHILLPKGPSINKKQEAVLMTITKLINKRFREKITLQEMAEACNLNASYLSTFFKAHVGIGFYDYVTKKRTAYAAYKLNTTMDPILEIAEESGFADAKALNLAFRKFFDMSPGEYRKNLDAPQQGKGSETVPVRLAFNDPLVDLKMRQFYEATPLVFDIVD